MPVISESSVWGLERGREEISLLRYFWRILRCFISLFGYLESAHRVRTCTRLQCIFSGYAARADLYHNSTHDGNIGENFEWQNSLRQLQKISLSPQGSRRATAGSPEVGLMNSEVVPPSRVMLDAQHKLFQGEWTSVSMKRLT